MKSIVTMTAYNRPEFLKQVLDAVLAADMSYKYKFIFSVEPGNEATLKLLKQFPYLCDIHINKNVLGCPTNTGIAINYGFQEADFVIHLEDDTVPSPDFFLYMDFCRQHFKDDLSVLTVSGYSKQIPDKTETFAIGRRNWFTPWGFATWKDRWEEIYPQWDWDYSKRGWDCNIQNNIMKDRFEVHPILSRIQNVGYYGCHVPSREFHTKEQLSPCVSNLSVHDHLRSVWQVR